MKKSVLFFILISSLSFSQKNLKISDLQPKTENFTFPVISYIENPLVENKINTFLQVNELEYVPDSGKTPFKFVSTDTNSYSHYIYFYDWEKLDAPKNILTIGMHGEASGAYSEEFTNWKNFDLRNGNFINAEDLFQPASKKMVEEIIQKKIKKRISDFLTKLKSEKNPPEEAEDQIALYEDCFIEHTLEDIGYFFGKDKLTFVSGRCSSHAMRALDELGSHEITFTYKELEKYWSPYAENLLSGSEKTDKTSLNNKLYQGKIDGKYPITVLISQIYTDGSFYAKYWYHKNKILIEWGGKIKDNHMSMIEDDYYSEELKEWIPRALVEAEVKGNKIIGTWQDYKTKKYLSIELEEL